jgi:hypothetical protein
MTISGQFDMRQLLTEARLRVFGCLILGIGGLCFSLCLLQSMSIHHIQTTVVTRIGFLAPFPVLGALLFGVTTLSNRWRIVEFTCDENSFRFRKWRSAYEETRVLSDIAGVREYAGRGLLGYVVTFRDGAEILSCISVLSSY